MSTPSSPMPGLKTHDQTLIRLRCERPALRCSNMSIAACDPAQKNLIFHRWNNADELVVACNCASREQTLDVPFPCAGGWRDAISGDECDADRPCTISFGAAQGVCQGVSDDRNCRLHEKRVISGHWLQAQA